MLEKTRQEGFSWDRNMFSDYNSVLVYYQAKACLQYAKSGTLLDLACGEGLMTSFFVDHFTHVVGVDAAGIHLAKAKASLPKVEFHEALIENFQDQRKFDNVFLLMVLEHVQQPVEILKKAATFLKDDGQMIIHVPNAQAINRRLAVKMGTLTTCEELSPFDINVVGHRRSYTIETLTHDAIEAGLTVSQTGGVFYKMLSTPQMDWFLKNGLWDAGHGWGRSGVEGANWKAEFCRACYELGLEQPEDCNVIFICATK
jgi:2-polyprenyl-3-methyl-5-hydroxy-6-metoxy-1,4-benzoquinol methylase